LPLIGPLAPTRSVNVTPESVSRVKVNSLLSEMERYLELDKNGDVEKRCLGFKVQPVTPPSVLKEKKMLHRMEMLCMQVQHDFTSNVERIEQGNGSGYSKLVHFRFE